MKSLEYLNCLNLIRTLNLSINNIIKIQLFPFTNFKGSLIKIFKLKWIKSDGQNHICEWAFFRKLFLLDEWDWLKKSSFFSSFTGSNGFYIFDLFA